MPPSLQPCENVFPGYQLTERIGSGGYAEVWRARAPGGIDKAVKIVYGCYDDQLAVQEMKAMERIKDVRHPFVLSLERFEVVDGRLAILTELADMSLEQRAQQCRAQGLAGIPRDELLRYMADTAEGLDFLAEKHSLQHLDIKPANLLISGEHIKVADFGLVKELASRTQNSIVAGMTPTYSSPEMFDDAPSPQSDQYSLAIVYQEMLTGVLPFPGRTAAQLANQHLRSQPQLAALAEIDRATVARALAKNPEDRFPSCRAFVKALAEADRHQAHECKRANESAEQLLDRCRAAAPKPATTVPRETNGSCPASSSPSAAKATELQPHRMVDTKAELKFVAKVQPRENIVDIACPVVNAQDQAAQPTLYIGVGGVGIRTLCRLRDLKARLENAATTDATSTDATVEMLAIDTDREELKETCSKKWKRPFSSSDVLHVSLRLPQEYRERTNLNLEWLSHRWLYNIPRSLETRGYRALGRLAVVDHANKVGALIDQKLQRIAASKPSDNAKPKSADVRVVLLAGMGGGTGSGMAIDVANAARARIEAAGHRAQIQGIFICTCLENISASPLTVANTYALLGELQFVSAFGNRTTPHEENDAQELKSSDKPFNVSYCVTSKHVAAETEDDGLGLIARHLSLTSTDGVRQMLQGCQQIKTPKELAAKDALLLRTFGSAVYSAKQAEALQTIHVADVDLLQCGYDRRTMIVVPSMQQHSEAIEALIKARPTAAVVIAKVDEPMVLSEGAGIKATSFARGLERVYPGIAEAASRLFTRIDVNWLEGML